MLFLFPLAKQVGEGDENSKKLENKDRDVLEIEIILVMRDIF